MRGRRDTFSPLFNPFAVHGAAILCKNPEMTAYIVHCNCHSGSIKEGFSKEMVLQTHPGSGAGLDML